MHLNVTHRSRWRAFIFVAIFLFSLIGLPATSIYAGRLHAATPDVDMQRYNWQQAYLKWHPYAPFSTKKIASNGSLVAAGPLWSFASSQQSPITNGLACLLCMVQNPTRAVDGDTTTYSTLVLPVGIAASLGQRLNFPGDYQAGDYVALELEVPSQLVSGTLLGGINIVTYNNGVSNNDQTFLNSGVVSIDLLGIGNGSTNKFRAVFPVASSFNAVQVNITSALAALGNLRIYEAVAMTQVTVTPSPATVNAGLTATLTPSVGIPNTTFNWYDSPTGGTPIATGVFTTPPLLENKTYYIEAYSPADGLHSYIRTAVPITVIPVNELACNAATTQAAGTSGVACLGCTVINPQLAVDSDPTTSSELRVGIGLLGGVFQGLGFPSLSGIADTLRIGISTSSQLLDVGLLTGITFTLYNGNTQVGQINNPSLLILRLPDDSAYSELVLAPNIAFDSVKIDFNALLAAISNIRVHYAKVTAPDAGVQDSVLRTCSGGSVTFNAISPAGATFRWYAAYTGGTPLFTGASFSADNLTSDTTFFVEAVSTGAAACGSNKRTPVFVKLGLPDVAVTPATIKVNKGQSAAFSVINPNPAYTYRWYDVETGGTALFTGTQFTTPAVNTAAVFYAAADSSGCSSRRTPVYVTVSTAPATPVIIPDTAFVSAGQRATFRIAAPDPALTYRWYNTDSGGTVLGTDTLYTTPAVTAHGYVYAEAVNSANEVSPRARAVVRLTDAPGSGPCTYARSQESPVYTGVLNICLLCGVSNPANAVDGDTTTFSRVTATIGTGSIGQMLHFGETGIAGDSIRLLLGLPNGLADVQLLGAVRIQAYNNGSPVGATVSLDSQLLRLNLITPNKFAAVLPVQANFDAVLISLGGLLTAITALDIYNAEQIILTAKPAADVDSLRVCPGSSARITAKDTAGITVQWFDVPTGGSPLFTGGIFNTPALNQPANTFYIASGRNGCANPVRVPVTVRTMTRPAAPQLVTAATTSCVRDTAMLSVANPQIGLSYKWYDAPAGGNLVDTGAVLHVIPASTGLDTVSYYVEAVINDCSSSTRAKGDVFVTINCGGPGSIDTTAITLCAGSSTILTVDNIIPGATYRWYNTANSSLVFTGTSFTTPVLNAGITYLVEASQQGGGTKDTSHVYQISVANTPPSPVMAANNIVTCIGGTATFNIQNPDPAISYRWYNQPDNGTLLAIGTAYTTAALNNTATFYVEAAYDAGCVSTARTGVTATVVNSLDAPLADAVTICSGQGAVLMVKNPVAGLIYRWYSTAAGGTPLFTGAAYTTPSRNTNTIYYLEAASGGGCVSLSRTAVDVTVNSVPATPQVSSSNVQVCPGQTAALEVQNPDALLTYRWYTSPAGGTPLTTGATVTTGALNSNQQYYVEAVNAKGCASNERSPVSVAVAAPTANDIVVEIPDPGCPGAVTLTASAHTVANPGFRWFGTASGGAQLATGTTFTTPALSTNTTYYVEVFTDGGCTSASRKAVAVGVLQQLAAPVVTVSDASASAVSFRWNSVPGATRYEVSTDNGATFVPPSSGANGTSHTISELAPNQAVTIVVRSVNTNSCQASELSAAISGRAANPAGNQVFIPNMFSPNGDGVNDIFMVYGNTIASMEMHIYNAWGQEVFMSKDQRQGWNGAMNGKMQPAGVYVYIVTVKLQNGTAVNRKGNITIIR